MMQLEEKVILSDRKNDDIAKHKGLIDDDDDYVDGWIAMTNISFLIMNNVI